MTEINIPTNDPPILLSATNLTNDINSLIQVEKDHYPNIASDAKANEESQKEKDPVLKARPQRHVPKKSPEVNVTFDITDSDYSENEQSVKLKKKENKEKENLKEKAKQKKKAKKLREIEKEAKRQKKAIERKIEIETKKTEERKLEAERAEIRKRKAEEEYLKFQENKSKKSKKNEILIEPAIRSKDMNSFPSNQNPVIPLISPREAFFNLKADLNQLEADQEFEKRLRIEKKLVMAKHEATFSRF